ncbi:MAG: ATP/GTP-binding protein [Microbacterium sp.]|uniref:ATP/GTP-binding protein n=1 Tax=Microbacterium sp. TaxID=51671 RepID=UPI003F9C323F
MGLLDDVFDKTIAKTNRLLGRQASPTAAKLAFPGLTAKGVEGPNLGAHVYIEAPPEFEASSMQVCGFWPFSVGASTALVGSVLGKHYFTGGPVCGDPMALFKRGIISSPSAFVLALNGRGKSSMVVRMLLGIVDGGDLPMILGDLKPDYVGFNRAIGGFEFSLGRGLGGINVLDAGPWAEHLTRLDPALRDGLDELEYARLSKRHNEVMGRVHGRRLNALRGLVEMVLREELTEKRSEVTVLSVAVATAADEAAARGEQPLPADVLRIITERHPRVRENILPASDDEYDKLTSNLRTGLNGLGAHGPFGDVFCRQTTEKIPIDRALCFDVSSIPSTDAQLRAAVQLACWSYGQSVSECAKILAEENLEPERHHFMVMDELWQILEAWDGSVYRINAITRVNRTEGLGQVMITHSMKDLELSTPERTKIARGFVERSSMLYLGGLARNEMPDLLSVRPFSRKEQDLLVSWSAEGSINPVTGKPSAPPGRGKFLVKMGDMAGIPFTTGQSLTRRERTIHDTNAAWASAIGAHGDN